MSQVIIPQVMFLFSFFVCGLFRFRGYSTGEPASGRVTYFILQAYTGTNPTNPGEIGRGFVKTAGEWTGRVEISKEKNPGSKCSMYGCILTYSRL